MAEGVYVFDGKNLDDFALRLRERADRVTREVLVAMEEIGEEIEREAKEIAKRSSSTIPETIRHEVIPGALRIRGGSPQVAIGGIFEMGNKGGHVRDKTFRHPVFGNPKVWVEQEKHPYLRPARALNRRQTKKRMEAIWSRTLRDMGIRIIEE